MFENVEKKQLKLSFELWVNEYKAGVSLDQRELRNAALDMLLSVVNECYADGVKLRITIDDDNRIVLKKLAIFMPKEVAEVFKEAEVNSFTDKAFLEKVGTDENFWRNLIREELKENNL